MLSGCAQSDNSYPAYQRGIEFFDANREKLQQVAEYFVRNPMVGRVSLCPDGVWGVSPEERECQKLSDQDIRLAVEQLTNTIRSIATFSLSLGACGKA